MNKQHRNTVTLDGSVPDDEVSEWIDDPVVSLKKTDREVLWAATQTELDPI